MTHHPPLPSDDLLSLLRCARDGDGRAREELVTRCAGRLLARIRLMMGERAREAAESVDLLQEAFLRLEQRAEGLSFADDQHLMRWLGRVARNVLRDRVRHQRAAAFDRFCLESGVFDVAGRTPTPSEEVRLDEARDIVADLILDLSLDEQRVIELRHFEQLPFAAIAAAFGRSENAVQLLHARALTRLGRALRQRGFGGDA